LKDEFASTQEAEVAAITIAVKLDRQLRSEMGIDEKVKTIIYSDHLRTVRRCQEMMSKGTVVIPAQAPVRHTLRWLGHTLKNKRILRSSTKRLIPMTRITAPY